MRVGIENTCRITLKNETIANQPLRTPITVEFQATNYIVDRGPQWIVDPASKRRHFD